MKYIPALKNDITAILKEKSVADSSIKEIENLLDKYSSILENVDSEHKRFKLLKQQGLINGRTYVEQIVEGLPRFVPENLNAMYIPLQESLKQFLEIPTVFKQIMDYINTLSKDSRIITNIIQADLWQTKYANSFVNDIVLPLYVYFDEIEVGNPLGIHAGTNKFGVVNFSIACLLPHMASRLNSIICCFLVHAEDKKNVSNEKD